MEKVIKYRLYCETDSKYEYVILEEDDAAPTTCPTNPTHIITADSVTAVDELFKTVSKVEEEIPAGGASNEFVGFQFTATKDTTTTQDFKIPVDFHLRNGDIECVNNVACDSVSFKIVDVDGIAYPAGTVLKQYVHNINIPTNGYYEFPTNKKTVLNLKDFYLRVEYTSKGTVNDVTVLCNMRGMDA
jgi:hypothetical protein